MSPRIVAAVLLVLAVLAAMLTALQFGVALTVGAALAVVLSTWAVQFRHEILHEHELPRVAAMSAMERHEDHLRRESARIQLSARAQKMTHLEHLQRYLEERNQARSQGDGR